jgi:hypothetical protein
MSKNREKYHMPVHLDTCDVSLHPGSVLQKNVKGSLRLKSVLQNMGVSQELFRKARFKKIVIKKLISIGKDSAST